MKRETLWISGGMGETAAKARTLSWLCTMTRCHGCARVPACHTDGLGCFVFFWRLSSSSPPGWGPWCTIFIKVNMQNLDIPGATLVFSVGTLDTMGRCSKQVLHFDVFECIACSLTFLVLSTLSVTPLNNMLITLLSRVMLSCKESAAGWVKLDWKL